jgi:hypothetical protein
MKKTKWLYKWYVYNKSGDNHTISKFSTSTPALKKAREFFEEK